MVIRVGLPDLDVYVIIVSIVFTTVPEEECHELVLERKSANICGREKELGILLRFAQGEIDGALKLMKNAQGKKTHMLNFASIA